MQPYWFRLYPSMYSWKVYEVFCTFLSYFIAPSDSWKDLSWDLETHSEPWPLEGGNWREEEGGEITAPSISAVLLMEEKRGAFLCHHHPSAAAYQPALLFLCPSPWTMWFGRGCWHREECEKIGILCTSGWNTGHCFITTVHPDLITHKPVLASGHQWNYSCLTFA